METILPAKPGRSTARIIIILGALNAIGSFSIDMYLAAFPKLADSFKTDPTNIQLTLSLFVLGTGLGQFFYGPLVDRFGRRPLLLGGIALYTVTSLSLIFAPDIESFIALRFIQALGACSAMIISRAIIRDLIPDEMEAARAFSLMIMIQTIGPVIAPVLGGAIVTVAGWRAVFLFLTAFGCAGFCAIYFAVGETLSVQARRRENLVAIVKSYLQLFATRRFIIPALAGAVTLSSLFAYLSGSPFIYMQYFGVSAVEYGWLFALNAVALIIASPINRMLLKRLPPRTVFIGGLSLCVIANIVLLLVANTHTLLVFLIPLWISIATRPVIVANATAIAMTATGQHAGTGSAIIGILQSGLGALLAALVGVLHNGTAYPMVGVMLGASILGLLIYLLMPNNQTR